MNALEAVKRYVDSAWPVSSLNCDGAYRKAWGESRMPNLGLNEFKDALTALGWKPVKVGECYIFRFRNDGEKSDGQDSASGGER